MHKVNLTERNSFVSCPIPHMTFEEKCLYKDKQLDEPIQKTIEKHVRNCSTCQDLLCKHDILKRVGIEIVKKSNENLDFNDKNNDESLTHVNEVQLAAYFDNNISEKESQTIRDHISSCYQCYQQYASIDKALKNPEEIKKTPAELVEIMTEPIETISQTATTSFSTYISNVWEKIQALFTFRLPVYALSMIILFVLGLQIFIGKDKTGMIVLPIPSLVEINQSNSHVQSGLNSSQANKNEAITIKIPSHQKSKIYITWAKNSKCSKYRLTLYDNVSNKKIKIITIPDNSITLPSQDISMQNTYTIFIEGFLDDGEILPIAKYMVRFSNSP